MTKLTTIVTQREISKDVIGHTKQGEPDIKIVTRPWYFMILIRVARVYLQSLLGILTLDKLSGNIDIDGITTLFIAAAGPAFYSLLLNTGEILSKLDTNENYSQFRA
jgi:hypothetical protein